MTHTLDTSQDELNASPLPWWPYMTKKPKAIDALNMYVMSPNHKIIWTVFVPEFEHNFCKLAIIVRASYGLKRCLF